MHTCAHIHIPAHTCTHEHICTHVHTCTHLHTLTLPLVTKSFICILCKQLVQKSLPLFKGEFNKKEKSRHLGKILFKKKKREGRSWTKGNRWAGVSAEIRERLPSGHAGHSGRWGEGATFGPSARSEGHAGHSRCAATIGRASSEEEDGGRGLDMMMSRPRGGRNKKGRGLNQTDTERSINCHMQTASQTLRKH